jgi:hypothetical protein
VKQWSVGQVSKSHSKQVWCSIWFFPRKLMGWNCWKNWWLEGLTDVRSWKESGVWELPLHVSECFDWWYMTSISVFHLLCLFHRVSECPDEFNGFCTTGWTFPSLRMELYAMCVRSNGFCNKRPIPETLGSWSGPSTLANLKEQLSGNVLWSHGLFPNYGHWYITLTIKALIHILFVRGGHLVYTDYPSSRCRVNLHL